MGQITEQRVIEIVEVEMTRFQEAMTVAMAAAITANNERITEQLTELGVLKKD